MSSKPADIAARDLTRLSRQQSFLRDADPNYSLYVQDEIGRDNIIPSRIYRTKLTCNSANSDSLTYTFTEEPDVLLYTQLVQDIPAASLLPQYAEDHRLAWCNNLGHNIFIEGNAYINGKALYEPLSSIALDIYTQFYLPTEKRSEYRRQIGAVPQLTRWGRELPAYTIFAPQPYPFTRHVEKGLFKFLLDGKTSFVYSVRKVEDLLRLQQLQLDGSWLDCPKSDIADKVQYKPLRAPDIQAYCAKLMETELSRWREITRLEPLNTFSHQLLALPLVSSNGNEYTLTIEGKYDARAIFWVAILASNEDINNYSNYTADPNDAVNGKDPIVWSSYMRDGDYEWIKQSAVNHSLALPTVFNVHLPDSNGYCGNTWTTNLNSITIDNTINMRTKNTLVVKVVDIAYKVYAFVDVLRHQRYLNGVITTVDHDHIDESAVKTAGYTV